MSKRILLQMTNISKAFSGVQALDHVNLSIQPGKVMCLAGENGCGKSTLVKIISGVYEKDAGDIVFDGNKIQKITPSVATKLGIQIIYQDLSIFPNLTVMENLAINSEISANRKLVNKKRMEATALEALSKLQHNIDLNAKMGSLSIANKQLIAICRALLFDAKLIIMDEPTTALTKKEVDALFNTIHQLCKSGIAVMFISHKPEEIFEISDDILIMRNGHDVYGGPIAELSRKDFVYYMTGRELQDQPFEPQDISEDPILEVKNLCLQHKYTDVTFDLRKGEILGITGLLGSGRTELALSLFGLLKAQSGEIYLRGKRAGIDSPMKAQQNHIGYVPEDRQTEGLCLRRPIYDNITLTSLNRLSNKLGLIRETALMNDGQKWVDILSILTHNISDNADTLSGGNQQKIVLAKWLCNDLDVLILNGPTVGVDIGAKQDIHRLVQSLAKKGLAIIIISDDLSEVVINCSRVLVMKDGKIVEELVDDKINELEILEIIR